MTYADSKVEDHLRDQLATARYEFTQLSMQLDAVEKRLKDIEEVNTRLSDRNWELQKRLFEQMEYIKTA